MGDAVANLVAQVQIHLVSHTQREAEGGEAVGLATGHQAMRELLGEGVLRTPLRDLQGGEQGKGPRAATVVSTGHPKGARTPPNTGYRAPPSRRHSHSLCSSARWVGPSCAPCGHNGLAPQPRATRVAAGAHTARQGWNQSVPLAGGQKIPAELPHPDTEAGTDAPGHRGWQQAPSYAIHGELSQAPWLPS